jgi:hypothetical protein
MKNSRNHDYKKIYNMSVFKLMTNAALDNTNT